MSFISKSGIESGSVIKSEHILRIINALDGTDEKDISVVGTVAATYLTGDATGLYNITTSYAPSASYSTFADTANSSISASYSIFADTASFSTTSLYAVTSSYILDAENALYATTASYVKVAQTASFLDLRHGAFYDNTTQSGSANISQSFKLSQIDDSVGVTRSNNAQGFPTRLYVDRLGSYNLEFSVQFRQGSDAADVAIWLKRSGYNVADTTGYMTIPPNSDALTAWNYVIHLHPSEYLELAWQSTSNNTTAHYIPATGNIPGSPSIILTLSQIAY